MNDEFICPFCNRVSATDRFCAHGNANITMRPFKIVPNSRYECNIVRHQFTDQEWQSFSEGISI